jgi:hypothetical protein
MRVLCPSFNKKKKGFVINIFFFLQSIVNLHQFCHNTFNISHSKPTIFSLGLYGTFTQCLGPAMYLCDAYTCTSQHPTLLTIYQRLGIAAT